VNLKFSFYLNLADQANSAASIAQAALANMHKKVNLIIHYLFT